MPHVLETPSCLSAALMPTGETPVILMGRMPMLRDLGDEVIQDGLEVVVLAVA